MPCIRKNTRKHRKPARYIIVYAKLLNKFTMSSKGEFSNESR